MTNADSEAVGRALLGMAAIVGIGIWAVGVPAVLVAILVRICTYG